MDRRIKKTHAAIYSAYLTTKKAHPGTEPSVKEICAAADINKSTFYRYFTDVENLSYAFIDFAVHKLLIDDIEVEKLLTAPEIYFSHVLKKFDKRREETEALLADNPQKFIFEAERIIKAALKEKLPEKYDEVLYAFIAGGAAHYFLSENYNDPNELQKFCKIIKAATAAI